MILNAYRAALKNPSFKQRVGSLYQISGLSIQSQGPDCEIGELCVIESADQADKFSLTAEVVGVDRGRVTLMPYGGTRGISTGARVIAKGSKSDIAVSANLLGRVIDGFGIPLDAMPAPLCSETRPLRATPLNPLKRPRIEHILETGVRSIDSLLTIGKGQRVGIFAGSGVGKSTLLGMITRHVKADVNVIALIGERGREVREFIEQHLAGSGLERSVVVVATSDQPALSRLRATNAAMAIAEYFRDQGKHVLLTMDSVTRFAMARREVGLVAGEPPTARGYTPSVFAEIPELCERCGTAENGGSITGLFTVLVDGDDFNEPISDCLRATLDGHIVLTRELAHQGQYPAIDVTQSVSRVMPDLVSKSDRECAQELLKCIAILDRNRAMVDMGAYEKGSNPALDYALSIDQSMKEFLMQSDGGTARSEAIYQLMTLLRK